MTFACRAHLLRNLPLPSISALHDEVKRVRGGKAVQEEDDTSSSKQQSTIVRLGKTKKSTICPYVTTTRSFTQTLKGSFGGDGGNKSNEDDEFICVDVVLLGGGSDVVYVFGLSSTHFSTHTHTHTHTSDTANQAQRQNNLKI